MWSGSGRAPARPRPATAGPCPRSWAKGWVISESAYSTGRAVPGVAVPAYAVLQVGPGGRHDPGPSLAPSRGILRQRAAGTLARGDGMRRGLRWLDPFVLTGLGRVDEWPRHPPAGGWRPRDRPGRARGRRPTSGSTRSSGTPLRPTRGLPGRPTPPDGPATVSAPRISPAP